MGRNKLCRPVSSALVILIIWILLEVVSNFVKKSPLLRTYYRQTRVPK